jgi:hypothetical protein
MQTAAEVAHWRHAVDSLADLDDVAAPAAWSGLEAYLRLHVRDRLKAAVAGLRLEAAGAAAALDAGNDLVDVRRRVLAVRRRYLQVETILDFFGDAVNTRTNPKLAGVLRGLDALAADSLDAVLGRLGVDAPPALVYLDKGLGASILRAGVRLWDEANPSPVAAIKVTRHHLSHPTSLLHETGHQVAHLTGWTAELAEALESTIAPHSREVAEAWRGWASEVAADVHAFAQAGWAPLPALANVVDGPTSVVYRLLAGDPHPVAWIRVVFNAELCRRWFGPGAWNTVARAWHERHPPERAPGEGGHLARGSLPMLGQIADVCTRRPMVAFHGRPLAALLDPRRVAPAALEGLVRRAGPSLLTSQYLARREPLRILAWLVTRSILDPANAAEHRQRLQGWLSRISPEPLARTA